MTKYHKLSSLKQQKYILPELWTLDVENQHVGRAALLLKPVGENPSLPLPGVQWWPPVPRAPWLAAQSPQPLSVSSQGLVLCDGVFTWHFPLPTRTPVGRLRLHPYLAWIALKALFPNTVFNVWIWNVWKCCLWLFVTPWSVQARILEWVATPFSRGSSPPRDWTRDSCTVGGFFTIWAKQWKSGKSLMVQKGKYYTAAQVMKSVYIY